MTTCQQCGGPLPEGSRRDRRYCSNACRMAASRDRQVVTDLMVPVGTARGHLPEAAHPDDQVAIAILEARGLVGSFLRLGREARPQLAWRCEAVGTALAQALHRYFKETE